MKAVTGPGVIFRSEAPRLLLAVTLAAIAGWVDAVGYLHFAHLFVSFMSGNSTIFGVEVGGGNWSAAVTPVLAIAAFVFGSFLGTLIAAAAGRWRMPAILALEAALLALALALPRSSSVLAPPLIPIAVAMGAQNAALQHVGRISVSLTYVTGALVKLGQSLAEAILGRSGRWTWSIYAIMWLGLTLGAIGGAVAYGHIDYDGALMVPAIALACLSLSAALSVLVAGRSRNQAVKRAFR
jgi:uncharacterized membrane protein YoaK (UPF0700 family)